MNSFIVAFWSNIFGFLSRISIFSLVRALWPKTISAAFVDAWVLGNLLLSIACVFIAAYEPASVFALIAVIYGTTRVFEVAVYQINVLLFDEYRAYKAGKDYALIGYRRLVLMLLHNYVEIIFWLATTYIYFSDHYSHKWAAGAKTAFGSIYSSFITMTTFGDFDLMPKSALGAFILLFHATVGLFMTLLSLARFVSLIPQPKSMDAFENRGKS